MHLRIRILSMACSFIFIFNTASFAQEPFDCIYAFEACDYSTIKMNYPDTLGSDIEDLGELCTTNLPESFFEENTVWIKYKFQSEGDFLFTITSTFPDIDIDFTVFKSETNSCDDLQAIRCMFTGFNYPDNTDPVCYGPTGLSLDSEDVEETPGCQIGDDNFLAPLQVSEGDVYFLAIRSFLNGSSYKIEHSGSAELKCMPVAIDNIDENKISVYPTMATDRLYVEVKSSEFEEFKFDLFNYSGQKISSTSFTDRIDIDIQNLPKGLYYTRIYSKNAQYNFNKFFKSH